MMLGSGRPVSWAGEAPPKIPPHSRAVFLHTPEGSPAPRTQADPLQDKKKDGGTSWQNFISISRSLSLSSRSVMSYSLRPHGL